MVVCLSRDLIVAVSKNRCFELAAITFKIVTSKITDTNLVSMKVHRMFNIQLSLGLLPISSKGLCPG